MREDLSKSGLKEIEAKAYLSRKDIEELIHIADQNMYENKKKMKNEKIIKDTRVKIGCLKLSSE